MRQRRLFILKWYKSVLLEIEHAGLKTVMWVACRFCGFFLLLAVGNVAATCQNYTVSLCDFFFFFDT